MIKLSYSAAVVAGLTWAATASGQVTLPAAAAAPPGSGANPGFVVKTVQAPPEAIIDNTFLRAIR
ncbi:MAG: hypothetical protein ACKV19_09210 [Verrucomicrobiales bacterium]